MVRPSAPPASISGCRVLTVDDDQVVCMLLAESLGLDGHEVVTAGSVIEARHLLLEVPVDLVILDLNLPGPNGLEFLRELRAAPATRLLPIVMLTGAASEDDRRDALAAGVTDFVAKPFRPDELRARVKALVRIKRFADELEDAERVIVALGRTIDARDPYTSGHSERVARYAGLLAERLGLSDPDRAAVMRGALFHDIGKIAVRDAVLLKAGPLDPDELQEVRRHPEAGCDIVGNMRSLAFALPVVLHHHERWDGSGYPHGLAGPEIPLVAQVTAVADVYDALTTDRPYRAASSGEDAISILLAEAAGGRWDPALLNEFQDLFHRSRLKVPRPGR